MSFNILDYLFQAMVADRTNSEEITIHFSHMIFIYNVLIIANNAFSFGFHICSHSFTNATIKNLFNKYYQNNLYRYQIFYNKIILMGSQT